MDLLISDAELEAAKGIVRAQREIKELLLEFVQGTRMKLNAAPEEINLLAQHTPNTKIN